LINLSNTKIAIIGLGYVGLPLAVEFSKKFKVVGFDINQNRINELVAGNDLSSEVSENELASAGTLFFTAQVELLSSCNVFIVTVPTPINSHKQPNLKPLLLASQMLGEIVKSGDVIIYESTVYPGLTEERCIPVLENASDLKLNKDFFVGYSPERINPGDKEHKITNILKVVSGSTPKATDYIESLYSSIIKAGTVRASSIKVAEAAKVIENTQRDVNIALINELAIIFNKLDIDTLEVLEIAGSKWNFIPFRPGLVGGHCIGVDPYYLTHKAQSVGYEPEIILAGRRLNDGMGQYVASQLVKKMIQKRIHIEGSNVLIMGLAFKENSSDLRNTKVVDIIKELKEYNINFDIVDPKCSAEQAQSEYGLSVIKTPKQGQYDAIILAVAHDEFKVLGADAIKALGKDRCVVYDLKYMLPKDKVDMRL